MIILGIIIICFIALILYGKSVLKDVINPELNMTVTSPAFKDGEMMPRKYTGRGEDVSPPLELQSLISNAKTIAIIMDDLDFPLGVFNHWVIWNIPAESTSIPEAITKGEIVTSLGNAVQGKSQYGEKHYYRGPLPPFGVHRYIFKVYVLDTELQLSKDAGKADLQKAMDGHIIQYGTLLGKFGGR